VLRWTTVVAGLVLAFSELDTDPGMAAALTGLLAWSTFRTFWLVPATFANWSIPLRTVGETPVEIVVAELGVGLGVVGLSGGWDSPFLLNLVVGVLLAGLSRGYVGGFAAAGLIGSVLSVLAWAVEGTRAEPVTGAQAMLVYVCTGAVAGFARRLFAEAAAGEAATAQQVAQLAEVNALLSELARVAPGLPASLDLSEALTASIDRLAELFDFTGAVVLVLDPATGRWRASASRGLPVPGELADSELCPALYEAARTGTVVSRDESGRGMWEDGASGLYAPLMARGRLVALIALEHHQPGRYGPADAELLASLAPPLALAIDNGLWFQRLRRLGAEAERERLARSLHDRVGAGLAYVGIELERLTRLEDPGPDLVRLRKEVGGLVAEVRETLAQLRARVTDTESLARLAASYLPRFESRTGILANFRQDPPGGRLPLAVEQELWRILQEALANVEQHSGARIVDVHLTVNERGVRLVIADDGRGSDQAASGALTGTGLETIRERANSIGARMSIDSPPDGGFRLTIEVAAGPEA
jgi:signal transduction histidine kinase